jgi:hypothetical protein
LPAQQGKPRDKPARMTIFQMYQRRDKPRIGPCQNPRQNARLRHNGQGWGRIGCGQQLAHFLAHAFAR